MSAPDRTERARRLAFVALFQYADIESDLFGGMNYDRKGDYLCASCVYYGNNDCELVDGPISGPKGSCRYWTGRAMVEGALIKPDEKLSQAQAAYGETEKSGFGCRRCEYARDARANATMEAPRPVYCTRGQFHVAPTGCCALNDSDDVWNA